MTAEDFGKMNEYYKTVEEYIQKGRLEDAAVNIRHILEIIVNDYVAKYAPEAVFFKTMDKINALEQKNCLDSGTIATLHQLRKIANKGAHGDGDRLSVSELNKAIIPLRYEMGRMKCDEENIVEDVVEDEEEVKKREFARQAERVCNILDKHRFDMYEKIGINPTIIKYRHTVGGIGEKIVNLSSDYKLQENLQVLNEYIEVDSESDELLFYKIVSLEDKIFYLYDKETGKREGCWVEESERQKSLLKVLLRAENTKELPIEYCTKKVKDAYSQFFKFIDCYRTNSFQTYKYMNEVFRFVIGDDDKIKWLSKQNKCLYIAPDISKELLNPIMNAYTLLFFSNRINPNGRKTIIGEKDGTVVIENSNSDICFGYIHNDDEKVIMIGYIDRIRSTFACQKCEEYEECSNNNAVCNFGSKFEAIREYPIMNAKVSVIEKNKRVLPRALDIDYKDLYEYFLVNNLLGVGEKQYVQASYENVIGKEPCVINLGYSEEEPKREVNGRNTNNINEKKEKWIKLILGICCCLGIWAKSLLIVMLCIVAAVVLFCYKIKLIKKTTVYKIGIRVVIFCIIYWLLIKLML